jgi:chaperonin GroEL (HSP60 family)
MPLSLAKGNNLKGEIMSNTPTPAPAVTPEHVSELHKIVHGLGSVLHKVTEHLHEHATTPTAEAQAQVFQAKAKAITDQSSALLSKGK